MKLKWIKSLGTRVVSPPYTHRGFGLRNTNVTQKSHIATCSAALSSSLRRLVEKILILTLLLSGVVLRAQLANLSCAQTWHYSTNNYYIATFTLNGQSVSSGLDWPAAVGTVGTGNTNMSESFTVVPGQNCSFTISANASYYNQFGLYIDWNNNGNFEQSEYIANAIGYLSASYSGTFSVPSTVSPGPKRMRVNWDYYYAYAYYGTWGPCQSEANGSIQYYGDCEDYVLNVGNQNDLSVGALSCSTPPPFSSGLNTITAVVTNAGTNSITSCALNYTLNPSSGSTISGTITTNVSLAPGASTTLNIYSYNFPALGTLGATLSVNAVNGVSDLNTVNNSAQTTLAAAVNGAYTIGGNSPDFVNFGLAVLQLNAGGTLGAVTFNVRNGTYTEALQITAFPGSLVTRPVKFQSESANKNSVILQFLNTSATPQSGTTSVGNTPALRVCAADNITFKNFTIAALSGSSAFGNAVELVGYSGTTTGCDNIKFDNMVFNGLSASSAAIGDALVLSANGAYHVNLNFSSCTFNQSSLPLCLVNQSAYSSPGLVLSNNSFNNFVSSGLKLDGTDGAVITSNTWIASGSSLNSGIVLTQHNGGFQFRRNRVNISGASGISAIQSGTRSNAAQAIFANNFIRIEGSSCVGLNTSSCSNLGIFHNTVYSLSTEPTFLASPASNQGAANNIFVNVGGGAALSGGTGLSSNYNDLYSSGAILSVWNTVNCATLVTHKQVSGQDAASSFFNPNFVNQSTADFSLTWVHPQLYGLGSNSNGTSTSALRTIVSDDFFGTTRMGRSEVYMGAHQLVPQITVTQAPATSAVVCAGQNLSMTCAATVSNGAVLSYQWYRNGVALSDGQNGISGSMTNILTISSAQPTLHAGEIVVKIAASGGTETVTAPSCMVSVNAPVSISKQPSPAVQCVGSELRLGVETVGTVVSYQWQKDGVSIPGATTQNLRIANVSFQASGTYRVVLSGTCGSTLIKSVDAPVVIAGANIIAKDPEITGATVGTTGYLFVESTVTGQPGGYEPGYQWFHGNVAIKDDGRVSGTTTSQLTIRQMQQGDITKDYVCVVTGPCGSQASLQGGFYLSQLTVVNQPRSQDVCLNTEVHLSILVTSNIANAQYSYQWKKDGKNVVDGAIINGANSPELVFASLRSTDTGDYSCLVTAKPTGTTIQSLPAKLRLLDVPHIDLQPKANDFCNGSVARFSTHATGGPIRYQWKIEGVEISGATSAELEFAADTSDNGKRVECIVSNGCSVTSTEALYLHVSTPPVITQQPGDAIGVEGSRVVLHVEAAAAVIYQWRRNGIDVAGATQSSYEINPFSAADAGAYDCLLGNACAMVLSKAAHLEVSAVASDETLIGSENIFTIAAAQPNPCSDFCDVRAQLSGPGPVILSLCDLLGRELIRHESYAVSAELRIQLDTRDMANGQYILKVQHENRIRSRALVVLH